MREPGAAEEQQRGTDRCGAYRECPAVGGVEERLEPDPRHEAEQHPHERGYQADVAEILHPRPEVERGRRDDGAEREQQKGRGEKDEMETASIHRENAGE